MSTYTMQQCLFDYLRRLEGARGADLPPVATEGYDLTDEERRALETGDVNALYDLGTHPVIINGYCRAMGYKRADYRVLFKASEVQEEVTPRWRTS